MSIAQIVFLLEHGHTYTKPHTELQRPLIPLLTLLLAWVVMYTWEPVYGFVACMTCILLTVYWCSESVVTDGGLCVSQVWRACDESTVDTGADGRPAVSIYQSDACRQDHNHQLITSTPWWLCLFVCFSACLSAGISEKSHLWTTTTTTTVLRPLDCVWDYPGEPVPER